ncbi:MAG: hypothetical protein ACYDC1_00665 [Limisphaerales bacterium]
MLKCHELVGFISPALAREILEHAYTADKPLYKAILAAVAAANRIRPAFFEKQPRAQRHAEMLAALTRPRMEEAAANLLRGWLLTVEIHLIIEFLDGLGVPHKEGVVEDFPESVDEVRLKSTVDAVLARHDPERVIIYLNVLKSTSGVNWASLDALIDSDSRLQLG